MSDPTAPTPSEDLGLEPEDLDGHTIDELEDYRAAGRRPRNPSIEDSAGCQLALEALESLHSLTPDILEADAAHEAPADEGWVQSILTQIAVNVRPGRRIPLTSTLPGADLAITEGAVRGVIRSAESVVPGVLIGRCQIIGDVTTPAAPVAISVEVSVPYGRPVATLADDLRREIGDRVRRHTELVVTGIDITVRDIHLPVRSHDDER